MRRRDVIIRNGMAFILSFALIGGEANFPVMPVLADTNAESDIESFIESSITGEQGDQKESEVPKNSEEETASGQESAVDTEPSEIIEELSEGKEHEDKTGKEPSEIIEGITQGSDQEKENDTKIPEATDEVTHQENENDTETSEVTDEVTEGNDQENESDTKIPEVTGEVKEGTHEDDGNDTEIPEITEEVKGGNDQENENDTKIPEITEEVAEGTHQENENDTEISENENDMVISEMTVEAAERDNQDNKSDMKVPEITEEVIEENGQDGKNISDIQESIAEAKNVQEAPASEDSDLSDEENFQVSNLAMKSQQILASTDSEPEEEELIEEEESAENPESGIALYSVIDDVLKEDAEKYICEELKTKIEDVASGNRTNSIFTIDLGDADLVEGLLKNDAKGFSKVVHALLNDCSYDLFWFDNTQEYSLSYRGSTVTFTFPVAKKYQSYSNCMTDANSIKQAKAAESTAKNIVKKAASKNDRDKLKNYMQEICSLTSYNRTALKQKDDPNRDTDAWQAVNVFSGKQAVCEGYSKAFRYLCDNSEFSSAIDCYTVTGYMKGSGQLIGGGDHMWNIVVIDGKSYLADVTNCDAMSSSSLFLAAPVSGSVETGYVFKISGGTVTYTYDEDTLELFGKNSAILKLAAASSDSAGQKPVSQKPSTQKPSTQKPSTQKPSSSGTTRPTTTKPSTSATQKPTTKPSTSATPNIPCNLFGFFIQYL